MRASKRCILGVVALSFGLGTSWAQQPSAPDLSHVKVGQKYHYTMTNAGAAPMVMIYEVTAVGPSSVNYTTQMIMDMGQGPQPVGEPNPMEWKHEPAPAAASPARAADPSASAVIGVLKTINTSQTLFREGDQEGDGILDYGTLAELSAAKLIDAQLGVGQKHGYRFDVRPSTSTPEFLWMATAEPVKAESGKSFFATNHAGVIYTSETTPFVWSDRCAMPQGATPVAAETTVVHEVLTLDGISFDCMVITSGNSKTWIPATGDVPTFPGLFKTQTAGVTSMELTRIENNGHAGSSSLHENDQLPAGHFKRYDLTLREARAVNLKLTVRNNAPVSYYFLSGDEGARYLGGGRESFFHVQQFYGEAVRTVNESKTLAAGAYSLVVSSGSAAADYELKVDFSAASGTPLQVTQPALGAQAPSPGVTPSGPGRYRLTVVGFNVSHKAKNNADWDGDGSSADVFFNLAFVEGSGVSNVQRIGQEQTWNNTNARRATDLNAALAQWEFDWNGRGDVILLAWDRDTMGHDLIAAGRIQTGAEPATPAIKLQSDQGALLNGALGKKAANGDITVLLTWTKLQ